MPPGVESAAPCSKCSKIFPTAKNSIGVEAFTCCKCGKLKDKRGVEREEIQKEPQCVSCGLVYSELQNPLCHACNIYWKNQPFLPSSLLMIVGVAEQVGVKQYTDDLGMQASNILRSADDERQKASGTRLRQGVKVSQDMNLLKAAEAAAPSQSGSAGIFGQRRAVVEKVKSIKSNAEQRTSVSPHVELHMTLWEETKPGNKKLVPNQTCNIISSCPAGKAAGPEFQDALAKLETSYHEAYPLKVSMGLSMESVNFHATPSPGKGMLVSFASFGSDWVRFSLDDLHNRFKNLQLTDTKTANKNRKILYIAVVPDSRVADPDEDYDDTFRSSASTRYSARASATSRASARNIKIQLRSATPAATASATATLKRKSDALLSDSESEARESTPERDVTIKKEPTSPFRMRRSAVPPSLLQVPANDAPIPDVAEHYRDPPMIKGQLAFIKTEYDFNAKEFVESEIEIFEHLQLASNWKEVLVHESKDERYKKTSGFIGEGSTKYVIYARYKARDYAVAQIKPHHAPNNDVNDFYLKSEFQDLADADEFKRKFDRRLGSSTLFCYKDKFYFPIKEAFIGTFHHQLLDDGTQVPLDNQFGKGELPYWPTFLATPLLPCTTVSEHSKPIKPERFTGNQDFGECPAPGDFMMELIHCYAHFSYNKSHHNVAITDLEGLYDRTKKLCLFDPQAHTTETSNMRPFWDKGVAAMECYINNHMTPLEGCRSNRFCRELSLWDEEEFAELQARIKRRASDAGWDLKKLGTGQQD